MGPGPMRVGAARVTVSEIRPVYTTPLSLSPTISVSKYPVFMDLGDALPRKYLKIHMVACRY